MIVLGFFLASVLGVAEPVHVHHRVAQYEYAGIAGILVSELKRDGRLLTTDILARSLTDRPVLLSISDTAQVDTKKILETILHAKWRETKQGAVLEPSAITSEERRQDVELEAKSLLMPGGTSAPFSLNHLLDSFAAGLGPQGLASIEPGSTVTYSMKPQGIEKQVPLTLEAETRLYQERIREVEGVIPDITLTFTRSWNFVGLRANSLIPSKGVVESANIGLRIEIPSAPLPPNVTGKTEVSEDIRRLCRFILDRQIDAASGRPQALRLIPRPYDTGEPLAVLAKPLLNLPADLAWFGIAPSDRWTSGLAEALLLGGDDLRTIWSKLKGGVVFVSSNNGLLARPRLNREFAEPILDRKVLRGWTKSVASQRREDVITLAQTYYQAKDAPLAALFLLRKHFSRSVALVRSEGFMTALTLVGSLNNEQVAAANSGVGAALSTQVKGQLRLFRSLTEEAWGEFKPEVGATAARSSSLLDSALVSQSRLWLLSKAEPGFALEGGNTVQDPLTYEGLVSLLAERCRAGMLAPDASMMDLRALSGTVRTTTLIVACQSATAQFKLGVEPNMPTGARSLKDIPELKNLIRDVKRSLGTS